MIYQVVLVSVGLVAQASAACSRAVLQDAVVAYIQAQAAGNPSLLPQAKNVSYAENDVSTDITKGVLSQAITIDFNRSIFDTTECSTFTEISAATNKHPYVIETRMTLSGASVTSIQSVVADSGDWAFNAAGQLSWAKKEKWDPIPEGKRDSRAVIKAAGDAYLDSWADGKVKVPYGTPCARLEGGSYTGDKNASANTCHMPEFPKPFPGVANRRYVIDEEMGGLGIFNDFPFIDKTRPNGTPSTNLLKVEGGQIRFIHETTVCATRNCGR
ncbi:uncharacterized protein K460DRAFT_423800 [Cucurbitaria berberidis CBS 394.84]|uniref:DUF8021 domain-containing protein n=1 Tax=Cucurbitaria berberidis CBS 394.84 TaxID=1168544 RepID=A0A9P4GTF2_9PLEO|nr:uncharacterized protein K460DRAFT_423800 [Cucurbitaria berberidis CBS 394.84]KAF1851204.1 hypothetical protein K460DRAFT_423800 [Cucurbitaria berberidis CBS 394.84]